MNFGGVWEPKLKPEKKSKCETVDLHSVQENKWFFMISRGSRPHCSNGYQARIKWKSVFKSKWKSTSIFWWILMHFGRFLGYQNQWIFDTVHRYPYMDRNALDRSDRRAPTRSENDLSSPLKQGSKSSSSLDIDLKPRNTKSELELPIPNKKNSKQEPRPSNFQPPKLENGTQ